MKNQEAYNWLTEINAHWGRQDSNHIYVWVSGYKHADCYEVYAKALNKAGMRLISENFDKICGKTKLMFRHK